jgi:hypothetical protein
MKQFGYHPDKTLLYSNVDVSHLFTGSMEKDLFKAIRDSIQTRWMTFQHRTCREEDGITELPFIYCSGVALAKKLAWVEDFYTKDIIKVVSETLKRPVKPIENIGRAITVQVLGNGMRVECHIDSYPTACNLYLQLSPQGGELAISPNKDTKGYDNILKEAAEIIPLQKMKLGIVNLSQNAHTVTYCWDGINPKTPVTDTIPDVNNDTFWETARIAVNFNFDDPFLEDHMPSIDERKTIYHHINGLTS